MVMNNRVFFIGILIGCVFLSTQLTACHDSASHDRAAATNESLGRSLFFDTSLSEPPGQACSTCHDPAFAFTDPNKAVSAGAVAGIQGLRSTPSLLYMGFSSEFHLAKNEGIFMGGQFWDGRAANLEDQASFPLLSQREMNNPSKAALVKKIQEGPHAATFVELYGADIFSDTEKAFSAVTNALAAFEMSDEFAPFSSKYDLYLSGEIDLTEQEKRGLELFDDVNKGNCAACHPSRPADGSPPLFTDFTYDNLGVPKNINNPFYTQPSSNNPDGRSFIDLGLFLTTQLPEDAGKMKVPTLRNVAITAPYFHNGVFDNLEKVVEFYNSRDLGGFDPPEVSENVNTQELGNLGLTEQEVKDIAVFLETLTDGYSPSSK